MPEQTTAEKLNVAGFIKQEDIDEIVLFLQVKWQLGLIPSDVIRDGNEFVEKFVDKFDEPAIVKMKIAACLLEAATIKIKLHPEYRMKRTRQG